MFRESAVPDRYLTGRFLRILCRFVGLMLLLQAPALVKAQSATGSITGQVSDQSGAVLPNAKVTLVDPATNQTRTAVSNQDGYYSFPLLPPATYSLSVENPGFAQFTQENIRLDVGLTLKVNAPLAVAGSSQSVTVTGAPPPLETQTSSLGQVIDTQQVLDLPTNGRNSYSFATLVPGVLAGSGFTSTPYDEYSDQFVSINGSRPNQSLFLLDGGINSESAFNGPGYFPSVDMVDQYKVQTNNFSAEFSNTAGGIINVITKSGTNKFHGSAWEFFRSDVLSANDFFSNRAGLPRGVFKFNQFGGTMGGPIKHDKTFFFGSYEGFRQTTSGLFITTVPTDLQRAGDFSQTYNQDGSLYVIYNPLSTRPDPDNPGHYIRDPFPGNKIPTSLIDPVAAALVDYWPEPNATGIAPTGVNNFNSKNISSISKNDGSLRVDQSLSDTMRLFGRMSFARTEQPYANLFGNSPNELISNPNAKLDVYDQTQATISFTDALRPSLFLELNTSFIRYTINRTLPGSGFDPTTLGFPSYFDQLSAKYPSCFPTIGVTGQGGMGGGCYILRDAYQIYNDYANLTKELGKHTFKFGANLGFGTLGTARYTPAGFSGNFGANFTQGPDPIYDVGTGYGFASFLLGTGSGSTSSGGPDQIVHYQYVGGYVQDDWKVTPRLTLNIGGRYDINLPFTERYNRFTDFNPTAASPLQVPGLNLVGGLEFPGVGGVPRSLFDIEKRDFAPRLGFAYSVTPSTVVRGGYGIFFGPITGGGFNGAAIPNTGFLAATTWVGTIDGVTPVNPLSNPFPQGFVFPTGSSQGLSTFIGQGVVGFNRRRPTPYAEQWNLDIQHNIAKNLILDVAYAGSHGVHLVGDFNASSLPDADLALGNQLLAQVPNPFYGTIQNGSLSGPTVSQEQLLLPYPQFAGVTIGGVTTYGASSYNALQVKIEKRYSSGFSVLGAYTWSKLMDNIPSTESGFPGASFYEPGPQDWNNLRANWSLSDFDVPHIVSASGSYELPFGHGRRFLNKSRLADEVVGGWHLNTIVTAASGHAFTVLVANNELFNGGTQYANYNGGRKVLPGPTKNKLNEYFDIDSFSVPGPFKFGNESRIDGGLRAPGSFNTDLSTFKDFKIHDRFSAQLRIEAFNVFNHPQFNFPDGSLGDGTTGIISSQANAPRQLQIAGRFNF
jgi:Carboxypeptidase regulatory-like domain/TonB dependent receptor